jgi:iron complex outermembrane receptor protein
MSTFNKEFSGSGDLHYGVNDFAFHANYFRRKTANYIGGNGFDVENSDQFSTGYQFGFSFIPSFGLGGLSYSSFNTKYGIPIKTEEEFFNPENYESPDPIDIEMNKKEIRFLVESSRINSFINSFSLKTGYQDYDHKEILKKSGEIETEFGLKTFSADLSFTHSPLFENIKGVFGIYLLTQNYTIQGEEAFTPNADYFGIAGYFVEQYKLGRFNLQFGARIEKNVIKIPESELSGEIFSSEEKDYTSLSASFGIVYNLTDEISLFSNFANAFRSPTIEELSSYSIHGATGTFDIGDRNLVNEKNIGFDFGFRLRKYHHLVELSGYYNRMKDFIFRAPTDLYYNPESSAPFNNFGEGVPVYRYRQSEAELFGFELKAQYEITRQISITAIMDYVKGNQISNSTSLPQIPPFRFSIEPRYADDNYWFGLNWKLVADQNNVAPFEDPTKGYGLVDLYVGTKILSGKSYHIVNLRAENLFNQEYRDHLSTIKSFALMPGRNVKLSYKFLF